MNVKFIFKIDNRREFTEVVELPDRYSDDEIHEKYKSWLVVQGDKFGTDEFSGMWRKWW